MIDYIIFGEFDINEGNVVRLEYPNKIGISDMILSSYIIPEGTHNIMTDSFCFIVNKPNNPEDVVLSNSKTRIEKFSQNSTKYFDLEKNLKNMNIEHKIYKIKQIYLFDTSQNDWIPVQNSEKDFQLIKGKSESNSQLKNIYNGSNSLGKHFSNNSINSNKNTSIVSATNFNSIGFSNSGKRVFYLIIQKDKNSLHYNLEFYESFQDNFIYSSNTPPPVLSIPIHQDIQFKKLNANFASFYTINSQAIGIELEEADSTLLEKLFENENEIFTNTMQENSINYYMDDYSKYLNPENSKGQKDLYFFCYLQTILNKSTKRGAILKSISIGTSKLINLHNFSALAKSLLDQIFEIHLNSSIPENDKLSNIKKIIENSYNSFNKIPADYFIIPNYLRQLESYRKCSSIFISPKLEEDVNNNNAPNHLLMNINGGEKIRFYPILSENQEYLFADCIEQFISTFKESTMIVYDALITDKKIMFIGDSSTPCEILTKFVFTCACLLPVLGISKRLNPYKNLYDLDFLNSNNCVYAVTNPIFKMKNSYWDIMCEIDTGKITFNENYKKIYNSQNHESDHFFIKELIYKIKHEFISEFEIKRYFKMYTSHILKLANEQYFIDDEDLNNEINKQYKRKISLINSYFLKLENELDKLREFISAKGVSLKIVFKYLDSLFYRKNISKEELYLIYSDIDKFMDCESNIYYVLSFILSNMHDIHIFLNGLFSKYKEIVALVKSICGKIDKTYYGAILMKKINFLYILRLNDLEVLNNNLNNYTNVDALIEN